MIVRSINDTVSVDWGNGTSHRLLVHKDGMGFTVARTIVAAGTTSKLRYSRHLEAYYCVAGRGYIRWSEGNEGMQITPGTLYELDSNDEHTLSADEECDLELVSVFAPALDGDEKHALTVDGYSFY